MYYYYCLKVFNKWSHIGELYLQLNFLEYMTELFKDETMEDEKVIVCYN